MNSYICPVKNIFLVVFIVTLFTCCNSSQEETITFYKVPLTCGADKEIGCGSRVKPLFIEIEKHAAIKEAWINRQGTEIAIKWNSSMSDLDEQEKVIAPLFKQFEIEAEYISDAEKQKQLTESFFSNLAPAQKGKDKWYKGMDVDQLSIEEAGSMGDSATIFALKAQLITETEAASIKKDIEDYMKTELVKVRTLNQLTSIETDMRWKQKGYEIYVKYVGVDRAENVRNYFIEYQKKIIKEKSCCEKESQTTSEITCPYCGHKKTEVMPEDVCQLVYLCEKCKKEIRSKEGDCCVFCSYGTHKCPSMQEEKN